MFCFLDPFFFFFYGLRFVRSYWLRRPFVIPIADARKHTKREKINTLMEKFDVKICFCFKLRPKEMKPAGR